MLRTSASGDQEEVATVYCYNLMIPIPIYMIIIIKLLGSGNFYYYNFWLMRQTYIDKG